MKGFRIMCARKEVAGDQIILQRHLRAFDAPECHLPGVARVLLVKRYHPCLCRHGERGRVCCGKELVYGCWADGVFLGLGWRLDRVIDDASFFEKSLDPFNPNGGRYVPLQIVWSRILVFPIWTERAHITRRLMNQTMPYHFILSLEALAAFGSRTTCDWAVVWSNL